MNVHLKLFGALREEVGEKELQIGLADDARVRDLRELLRQKYPAFDRLGERIAVSVNFEMSEPDAALHEGDEVAFLPPVSGGSGDDEGTFSQGNCSLSDRSLDEAEVIARIDGPDAGGVVSFVGNVRDHARGRAIKYLEYEAYPEMALREMEKIAREAEARWPGTRVAIAHRSGHLEIGDAAVVVVAVSPHRAEAFEACRFAIDTLKLKVPIWKKEVAMDGQYWVDDHA